MKEWRDIGVFCKHCGQPLEAKPYVGSGGIVFRGGGEPMYYRHKKDRREDCRPISTQASPYTGWGMKKLWDNADSNTEDGLRDEKK